jgi:hypothetical protein
MATNYTISRAVPRDPASEYTKDELFGTDRRHNALTVNPRANNYVRTVTDNPDDQFDDAVYAAGADLLGQRYPYARAGFIRRALRPASHGAGRDRWR